LAFDEHDEQSLTLPFSAAKQQALLAHLLTDSKFFAAAYHRIRPDWFTDPRANQLWSMALKFNEQRRRSPTPAELGECQAMTVLDLSDQNKLRDTLKLSLERRIDYGLDALSGELTDWLHAQIFMSSVKKAERLFNAGAKSTDGQKLQEAYNELKRMSREIDEISFEPGQIESMDDPVGDFERQLADAKSAISFGLPALNRLLLPEGDGAGSLLKGDMTVLLAPTNIGKTTTMVTIAAYNLLQGKDVLLVTHEGRVDDIKLKIWQSLTGLSRQDIMRNLANKEFVAGFDYFREMCHRHLEFMPLNRAGLTVEEVEAAIRRRQDRWQSQHNGKCFDLVIDDYAAKLTTQQARGGNFQLRQIHEIVYNYFSQIALAKGQECHVVTAIQTNRQGSRESRHGTAKDRPRLLQLEDVMEAWGPMTTATNVISINRDDEAQAKDHATFCLLKSRSSQVGWSVLVKSDYAAARSHWDSSACTWYRGSISMSDRIDNLLETYSGAETPWQEVMAAEGVAIKAA
jgi:replicative DNA helicase